MKNKRVVITRFGGPEVLEIQEAEMPPLKAGEVLVKVLASALSGADVNMRRGTYPMQKKSPLTPGYSIVGELPSGERVACMTVYDGHAQYVAVPEAFCVKVSAELDPKKVVCLVLDGMTAYQMLTRSVRLKRGDRIFVHGVSGAVGSALALLARARGIECWGTASPAKHPAVTQALGVAKVFDYKDPTVSKTVEKLGGVDAVFDPLGYDSFSNSYAMLRPGGVVVGYGFNGNVHNGASGNMVASILKFMLLNLRFNGKRTRFYGINRKSSTYKPDLVALMGELGKGSFSPLIKKEFKLDQIREAHAYWSTGEGLGSIVITP